MIEIHIDTPGAGGKLQLDRPAGREPFRLSGHAPHFVAHAPLLVSLVLGALITVEVAHASLTLWGGSASNTSYMPASVSIATAPRPRPIDVQGIVAAHLFGEAVDDPNAHDATLAQHSAGNLLLTGTLATDDPRTGLAIISDSGKSSVYRVGDDVADGSLHSVYRDHVLLSRHGRLQALLLPRVLPANGGSGAPAATASRAPASRAAAAEEGDSPDERPRSAGDVFRGAGIVASGGKLQGFRIFPAGDRRTFDESGLRDGDLAVAINGTPLQDQDRRNGQMIFNSMKSSSQATLTIERAGQRQDVTINAPEHLDVESSGPE